MRPLNQDSNTALPPNAKTNPAPLPPLTPPAPLVPILPEGHSHINDELQASLAALAHKHVTISYTLAVILAFVLTLGGVGAYLGAKWVDRAMARAEKAEELYHQDKAVSDKAITDLQTQLAQSKEAQAAAEARQAELQKEITVIAANAQKQKDEVLKPGKTASEAYADTAAHYKLSSPLNIVESPDKSEQLLAFRIPDIQQMTATKIDDDAAHQTITAKDQQLAEKDKEISSLQLDKSSALNALGKLQTTDAQCEDALKKYKTIAKVSRFKKILKGAIKGVEIGGALVLGYEIGHRF